MTSEQITALIAERDELQKQLAEAQRGPCEKLIIALGKRMTAQTEIVATQTDILQDIAHSLRQLAQAQMPAAPNYQRPLADFPTFDWASIGAEPILEDRDGVAEVGWNGQTFKRRSAQNKFAPAIWFNRSDGKDADGNVKYVRLITFKAPTEAEVLPGKTTKALGQANSA